MGTILQEWWEQSLPSSAKEQWTPCFLQELPRSLPSMGLKNRIWLDLSMGQMQRIPQEHSSLVRRQVKPKPTTVSLEVPSSLPYISSVVVLTHLDEARIHVLMISRRLQ